MERTVTMHERRRQIVDSPLGRQETDYSGSPVGVARLDVNRSYAGIGELLQEFINEASQKAWEKIKAKIDYTFEGLDLALSPLEKETGFGREIKSRLETGQKLLFKPNLVNPTNIDPQTHGPDFGYTACTEWPFVAALMRWFHDKIDVSYYQMALGEAATMMTAAASLFSMINPYERTVTPEAVIEGRTGDFYGGWGFYFARKYLTESAGGNTDDDPMRGFEESMEGTYIPPGHISDKLMVYDLNRIFDDPAKGRDCIVPDGVNYHSITLHKVIVGGAPEDPEDIKAYPGSILVNVPKLKVHAITLFTNVIKNLGIGLYPTQYSSAGNYKWDYSLPHDTTITGIKGRIPHEIWVPDMDHRTGLPKRDAAGNYIVEKTGGINATMIDVIKATSHQDIFMIHIVDAVEAINVDHQGINLGEKAPEGMVFSGLDPVATDTLSARYMFSNVPLKEAGNVELKGGTAGGFPQAVPIPALNGNNIVSNTGYDCPLSRDKCFEDAVKRGMGQTRYYVIGHDRVTDLPLVSILGHLGTVKDGAFFDLITTTLFYDTFSSPWDMQRTMFSYMEAVDNLEGTSIKKDFLEACDEDGDGIVTYEEFGKKGALGTYLHMGAHMISELGTEELGFLKGHFKAFSRTYKNSDPRFNKHGHNVMKELFLAFTCSAALEISRLDMEFPDPFVPGLTCGQGKWPSFQLARYVQTGFLLYGQEFPNKITFPSLYTAAFFYADLTQNRGQYVGTTRHKPDPEAASRYISDLSKGKEKPLDFVFYIPAGFDNLLGAPVPNVEVTDNPGKILTVSFEGEKEIWSEPE